MGTRSVISVNGKSGFYKHWDGYPDSTIPTIIAYINMFGYDALVTETERIINEGGCSYIFYMNRASDESSGGIYEMLMSGKLTDKTYKEGKQLASIDGEEFGYYVAPNKIDIRSDGKVIQTIQYEKLNDETWRRLLIGGIIDTDSEFNLQNVINKMYGVK